MKLEELIEERQTDGGRPYIGSRDKKESLLDLEAEIELQITTFAELQSRKDEVKKEFERLAPDDEDGALAGMRAIQKLDERDGGLQHRIEEEGEALEALGRDASYLVWEP